MRLRHVILLASGAGAIGALLLAADIHRRVQEAQRDRVLGALPTNSDSVIHFGDAHMLGLLALAFLFLALFLLIFSEPLRQVSKPAAQNNAAPRVEVNAVPRPAPAPAPVSATDATEVFPLADATSAVPPSSTAAPVVTEVPLTSTTTTAPEAPPESPATPESPASPTSPSQ